MTAQISIGQIVFSADTSTHGCREGWAARVTAVDGDTVTAVVTSNTHCYGCWQTGCVDDDAKTENDQRGRVVTFDATWAIVDDDGDVYARNWLMAAAPKWQYRFYESGKNAAYIKWATGEAYEWEAWVGDVPYHVIHWFLTEQPHKNDKPCLEEDVRDWMIAEYAAAHGGSVS